MTSKSDMQGRDIRVVVLAGGLDFGRCPLMARLPAALWPVGDKPALVRLLDHLAEEGVERAIVCCAVEVKAKVEAACRDSRLTVTIRAEELVSGTGGCLRDAVSSDPGALIVMFSGSMAMAPCLADMVDAHQSSGADMTVVFNPAGPGDGPFGPAAEIFLCRPQVLSHIPRGGYSDIKEGVIPAILRAGGKLHPLVLDRQAGNFHDRKGYLDVVEAFLGEGGLDPASYKSREDSEGGPIFKGAETYVDPLARVCGPVVMGDRARILEGAVVVGPAMIGCGAVIGENSEVIRSALWAGATLGARCEVRESTLDYGAKVPDGAVVVGRVVPAMLSRISGGRLAASTAAMRPFVNRLVARLAKWTGFPEQQVLLMLAGIVVFVALLWSYWPTVLDLIRVWNRNDEYSSGMLVPFLAVYVIWSRRHELSASELQPALWWGALALLLTQAGRIAGLFYMYRSAERLSLVVAVAATVLLMLGWKYLARLTPVLLFLFLMLPWPNRVQSALALPLQRWATSSAVFCLELAGWDVLRDGNVIRIGNASVAVAEACNGLRMITAFFVISALVVLLVKRPWWAKLIVLASSLPIALLCNTVRLAVTSVAFTKIEGEIWEQRFHDYGGYAMMPLALAMVVGELWLLTRLTTPPTHLEPAIISRRQPQHVPDP